MKLKLTKCFTVILLCSLFSSLALAVESPVTMMQRISNKMISLLSQNQSRLKSHPKIIENIVNQTLIPHVDLNRMGASVVGRRYWFKASPAQRQRFIQQFTKMVIGTYSSALSSFDRDRISFYPLRVSYHRLRTVAIRSVIIRRSGQRIPVAYNVVRKGNGWKIYDFSIENVSMMQSYRAQFAGTLANSGLAGLIQKLIVHNRRVG